MADNFHLSGTLWREEVGSRDKDVIAVGATDGGLVPVLSK